MKTEFNSAMFHTLKRSGLRALRRGLCMAALAAVHCCALAQSPAPPRAFVDGSGLGWRTLAEPDFTNVNCATNTWTWKDGGVHCTGQPVGVIRTHKQITNFELVAEWRHLQSGGNSGIFVWASDASIKDLEAGKGRLPNGIEVQV